MPPSSGLSAYRADSFLCNMAVRLNAPPRLHMHRYRISSSEPRRGYRNNALPVFLNPTDKNQENLVSPLTLPPLCPPWDLYLWVPLRQLFSSSALLTSRAGSFLVVGADMCIVVGCSPVCLAYTHWMPIALPLCDKPIFRHCQISLRWED